MCARYVFFSGKAFSDQFGGLAIPDLGPRYNIAPTQPVVAVASGPEAKVLQWGLVPSWAKDPSIGARMINARAETVAEKPSFRTAFKRRRCLLPADGFYEWVGEKGHKQPFFLQVEPTPFAFAGLWEIWEGPDGYLETCTIITTEANDAVRPIHDRMPVVIDQVDYGQWLDTAARPESLMPLLAPAAPDRVKMWPVGKAVGNPRIEGPELIEAIA
ncbi:MAG: SOS response-associated peptidase [Fimbriimonadaceae bacterium]|nr:SOS response-associated peptidase [Fimbriimonadaceae bacterium]QYK58785.1 MAG: SOS response-associated peptidase [Fimbriimonadaceae bacterium]